MARKIIMDFKKGDARTHFFKLPAADWSAGGTLFFAAKPAVDNDATDAAAVINKSFSDSVVTNETIDGVAYKVYTLLFLPGDITGVNFSNGESVKKYLGEFQFVPSGGSPNSYPDDNNYIEVEIFADIRRATV